VWAAQGYVVFVPNFTGSTGFGQAFVDAVARDWGGAPFEDMRKGWAHVLAAFPEIDRERAGAVGGSWGGYAVNFIQGRRGSSADRAR
jgi:dipeptidyl aminopeptidase/acylaminoacyl peptidase